MKIFSNSTLFNYVWINQKVSVFILPILILNVNIFYVSYKLNNLFIFQLRIIVNSLRDLVNAFVPSGKIMQIVDQKLVRNIISHNKF